MGDNGRELSRRVLLRGAALTGVAVPVLAACGADDEPTGSASPSGSPSAGDASTPPPDSTQSPAEQEGTTVATADVPVGGGTILAAAMVVVTQPAEGEFEAFSAVCTHQGCPVQEISNGTINCNCHGSKFSVEDGSVVSGPATEPLERKTVSVDGDSLRVS
ncbi:MAG: ubiquinol-cytochrome c reductase iron-sulfur subunit [Actinomycetota bacterium]